MPENWVISSVLGVTTVAPAKIAASAFFGIDDDGDAGLPSRRDDRGDRPFVEDALAVVGENGGARRRERVAGRREYRGRDRCVRRMGVLGVDPEELMPAAQIACLDRGRPARVGDQPVTKVGKAGAEAADLVRIVIRADQPDQGHRRPVGEKVSRDIARAAEKRAGGFVLEDRDRRLRRDPGDLAFDEAIKQNIADDEDIRLGEPVDDAISMRDLDRFPDKPLEDAFTVSPEHLKLPAMFERLYADHLAAFERARSLLGPAAALSEAAISVLRSGGKLLFCGNGGSAADSQHIATEFTIRFERARRGLPAIALTTDSSALTASSNDFGFAGVFARQIEALGQPGDCSSL